MDTVTYDFSEFKDFFGKMRTAANGDFRREVEEFLVSVGTEFLRIIQDEIERRKVTDTRLLINSFARGADGNVWELDEGGLVLEVGTNVKYAAYVNDGHWTCAKGEKSRFVPGRWEGDRFIYDPNADTGMILKQKWISGAHYWESALRILDKIYPGMVEEKLQQWIDKYFS